MQIAALDQVIPVIVEMMIQNDFRFIADRRKIFEKQKAIDGMRPKILRFKIRHVLYVVFLI